MKIREILAGKSSRRVVSVRPDKPVTVLPALFDEHNISSVRRQLRRLRANPRPAGNHRVQLPTGLIGHSTRCHHCLKPRATHIPATRLGECKYVRHQSTFASSLRSRISSGTASFPSPIIRPAARSGGSAILSSV